MSVSSTERTIAKIDRCVKQVYPQVKRVFIQAEEYNAMARSVLNG